MLWGPAPLPCWPPLVMAYLLSVGKVGGPWTLVGTAAERAKMAERVASCIIVLVEAEREVQIRGLSGKTKKGAHNAESHFESQGVGLRYEAFELSFRNCRFLEGVMAVYILEPNDLVREKPLPKK